MVTKGMMTRMESNDFHSGKSQSGKRRDKEK